MDKAHNPFNPLSETQVKGQLLLGMSPGELHSWTAAMIDSGVRMDLSTVARPTVDKHSTGGVGDKTSLVLRTSPVRYCIPGRLAVLFWWTAKSLASAMRACVWCFPSRRLRS